ncbi:MAG: hypothetical protein AAF982_09060 [Pseudomonadota bacterium]
MNRATKIDGYNRRRACALTGNVWLAWWMPPLAVSVSPAHRIGSPSCVASPHVVGGDGAMDGGMFTAHAEIIPAPMVREGGIAMLDDPRRTTSAGPELPSRAPEQSMSVLPPYSPGFKPIAQNFAKIKSILRKFRNEYAIHRTSRSSRRSTRADQSQAKTTS